MKFKDKHFLNIALKSDNYQKKMNAISKIEDQDALYTIALSQQDVDVITAAVSKITDQCQLEEISRRAKTVRGGLAISTAAIMQMTDIDELKKIETHGTFEQDRSAARRRLAQLTK